jgi:hypothetical protein
VKAWIAADLLGALDAGVVQGLSLEDAEPNLDLIEPARAGRREVTGHVRMAGELVVVLLMGVQVVQVDADLPVSGLVRHDLVHKGLEVGVALAALDFRALLQSKQNQVSTPSQVSCLASQDVFLPESETKRRRTSRREARKNGESSRRM